MIYHHLCTLTNICVVLGDRRLFLLTEDTPELPLNRSRKATSSYWSSKVWLRDNQMELGEVLLCQLWCDDQLWGAWYDRSRELLLLL